MVLPTEVSAVLSSGYERMMSSHDHQPAAANGKPASYRVHHLRYFVGGTARCRVCRLGAFVQPPLGIQEKQPKPSEIHDARSGTATPGAHHDCATSGGVHEALLPSHCFPAFVAVLGPIVIAHHHVAGGASLLHHHYLRTQPSLGLLPFRSAGCGKALRIRIVAEEQHHSAPVASPEIL